MLEEKRTTPHPNSQTLRNASHHALSQAVRTHTTNEQAQTHPLSFLSRSIAVDTTGLRTSGKKEEESQARSHLRNAIAESKKQGGRWWWGAL